MSYEFFYSGSPYSLDPSYGELFSGYRVAFSELGAPTSIQTANQIQEVTNLLNQGGKVVELQPIQTEAFEQIPKQHFKEINRLTKLTGTSTTLHAPMIDPAGFSQQGWSEMERVEAERHFKSIVEKAHELNPEGGMPITIHASGIQGSEFAKPSKEIYDKYKKQLEAEADRSRRILSEVSKNKELAERYGEIHVMSQSEINKKLKDLDEAQAVVINQESGQLTGLKREEKFYPSAPEGRIYTPEEDLKIVNESEWDQSLSQLAFYKQRGDEILKDNMPIVGPRLNEITSGQVKPEQLEPQQRAAYHQITIANTFMKNALMSLNSLYNKAYKYSSEEDKKKLLEAADEYKQALGKNTNIEVVSRQSEAISQFINKLGEITPQVYKKVEDFAKEKSAETLGNTAFDAYNKYKDKAPIISIENMYSGMAFSKSEDLKALVEGARAQFVKQAEKKGIGESEAKKAAEKILGVTWDVGHLNLLRKGGFTEEELLKETEQIAKMVKHVHITDNFGYTDSHLPPGMGNVPTKKILEELEKQGFQGKKIIEAGGFAMQFKSSPTSYILEAFGSPLYAMKSPYWNQMPAQGNYFALPSAYFPEQHFSMYGSGFSSLPTELGGQVPGKQSRFTGAGME